MHGEPIGLYSEKLVSLKELHPGSTIAILNDPSNDERALTLLEGAGIIQIDRADGLAATEFDIVSNSKTFKFKTLEAAQLLKVLKDVDQQ